MRHAPGLSLIFLVALATFPSPLPANSQGPATPIVFYKNRGVSVSFCVGAVVVAATLGLIGGNYWRGQQSPEFLDGALRPLVSAEASVDDLNTPHRTIVLSAERYYVEAAGITHFSGAVLPGSKDTIAVAALQNLIIRQDSAGLLHGFNPLTQKWTPIFDKKVRQFKTSMRNLVVLDDEGTLHCYWIPFEGKFQFKIGEGLTIEDFTLKAFPEGKFDSLISVDGLSVIATDTSDPANRRILILNEKGVGILKEEGKRDDLPLQEFLRRLEENQRRAQGEAPQA